MKLLVVHVDKSYGTMNTPERFKDYVVTGIKHRQPENWESPMVDTSYYEITPIGETQEQRLGRMLAGGGMIRREQLHPTDGWVLRKGFLRGELGEHQEELEEFCPMGNPNKCTPVDYDKLPDMLHEHEEGRNMKGFTPKLIGYLKFMFGTQNITNVEVFQRESQKFMGTNLCFFFYSISNIIT